MNNRTYLIPGLKSWIFTTSSTGSGLLSGNGGPGVTVTSAMPVTDIAEQVKSTLWLRSRMTDEVATSTAKAVLIVDWQSMIQEAGTDVQHQTPSLPGWTLRISDVSAGLWHSSGGVVHLRADTSMQKIIVGVRRTLHFSATPEEIEGVVQEVMRIDFAKLITNAWAPRVAPLLEGCTADNSALISSICADVMLLAKMQKANNTALGNEICALVKKLT